MKRLWVVLIAALLVLSGCGGFMPKKDDDSKKTEDGKTVLRFLTFLGL